MDAVRRALKDNWFPFVVAVAAMLTQAAGPLDWLSSTGAPLCSSLDAKKLDDCKGWWRFGIVLVAFGIKFVSDFFQHQLPANRLEDFRAEYLESQFTDLAKAIGDKCGLPPVRLNVMVLRRIWWSAFLLRRFEFAEHGVGFESVPGDVDKGVSLMLFQGVAGRAAASRRPEFARMHPPHSWLESWVEGFTAWWFFPWQVHRLRHVRWVLAVPMLYQRPSGPAGVRGVLTVTVVDDGAAKLLQAAAASGSLLPEIERLLVLGRLAAFLW